jgi:hypothetical protein
LNRDVRHLPVHIRLTTERDKATSDAHEAAERSVKSQQAGENARAVDARQESDQHLRRKLEVQQQLDQIEAVYLRKHSNG